MNFLRSPVAARNGRAAVRLFGQDVPLPAPASLAGRDVVIGIRPEHIAPGPGLVTLEVSPRLVESLGSEKYVYVDVPEENRTTLSRSGGGTEEERRADTIIARLINAEDGSTGNRMTVSFDPGRLHLFDAHTEEAIVTGGRA
jgi:multiple sugar transport system ATP-binding protein